MVGDLEVLDGGGDRGGGQACHFLQCKTLVPNWFLARGVEVFVSNLHETGRYVALDHSQSSLGHGRFTVDILSDESCSLCFSKYPLALISLYLTPFGLGGLLVALLIHVGR